MILFSCPSCRHQFKADNSLAGNTSTCTGCGKPLTIPQPYSEGTITDESPGPSVPQPEPSPNLEAEEPEDAGPNPWAPKKTFAIRPTPTSRDRPDQDDLERDRPAYDRPRYEDYEPETPDIRLPSHLAPYGTSESDLSGGDILLCVLCSGIACWIGLFRLVNGKPNGGKMLGLSLVFIVIWSVVRVLIETALNR